MMSRYRVEPCHCMDTIIQPPNAPRRTCSDWHVAPVANVWGVHFTKEQAQQIADLLNGDARLLYDAEKEDDADVTHQSR